MLFCDARLPPWCCEQAGWVTKHEQQGSKSRMCACGTRHGCRVTCYHQTWIPEDNWQVLIFNMVMFDSKTPQTSSPCVLFDVRLCTAVHVPYGPCCAWWNCSTSYLTVLCHHAEMFMPRPATAPQCLWCPGHLISTSFEKPDSISLVMRMTRCCLWPETSACSTSLRDRQCLLAGAITFNCAVESKGQTYIGLQMSSAVFVQIILVETQ